jgi:phosphoglycolate phosphatase
LPRPSLADVRGWIGDGIEVLIGRGFSAGLCGRPGEPAMFPLALEAFDRCYAENLYRESRLYPDVPATLDALADAGLVVGCVTNKRERFARELLRRAGIERQLRFVFGGDSLGAKKPDPVQLRQAAADSGIAPAEAVMVGDSINDREAARRAGFGFVFAAYGYSRPDDPALTDGLAVIRKFGELAALLSGPRAGQ